MLSLTIQRANSQKKKTPNLSLNEGATSKMPSPQQQKASQAQHSSAPIVLETDTQKKPTWRSVVLKVPTQHCREVESVLLLTHLNAGSAGGGQCRGEGRSRKSGSLGISSHHRVLSASLSPCFLVTGS